MSPTDYQRAAARTLPDIPHRDRLSMLALGAAGEWSEYRAARGSDSERDEAGDVLWYIAGLCSELGMDMTLLPNMTGANLTAADALGAICEPIKKHLYHGKDLDKARVLRGCANLYTQVTRNYAVGEVMAANVAKLRKRWPDGFGVGG